MPGQTSRLFALTRLRPRDVPRDLLAGAVVTLVSVPQGIAYALIAGLPPVAGLYACSIPVIVGALFRSSRVVITGPSNALSLLVGGIIAARTGDPMAIALALALWTGLIQVLAGLLRLGTLVDYLSAPVVRGYITGVAVLIAVGQLPNLTDTEGTRGPLARQVLTWAEGLGDVHLPTLGLAVATAALIVLLGRLHRRMPDMALGVVFATLFSLLIVDPRLRVVADIAPIPTTLPPFSLPDATTFSELIAPALAVAVLSLVESSAVARDAASRTGRRLDPSREFVGQGLANLAASLCGAYPTSGSPSRTALSIQAGARTRLAGVGAGVAMLFTLLLLGPVVDRIPVAALGGVLMVVAWRLVDAPAVITILRSRPGDVLAFCATLGLTWLLPLDTAIYIGVLISVVMFLRRVSHLVVREMTRDASGQVRELLGRENDPPRCCAVRILDVQGAVFFASAGELRGAIDAVTEDEAVRVVVLRLKRTQAWDLTGATALADSVEALESRGLEVVIVGLRSRALDYLRRVGALKRIGEHRIVPGRGTWLAALREALRRARGIVAENPDLPCADCPMLHPPTAASAPPRLARAMRQE